VDFSHTQSPARTAAISRTSPAPTPDGTRRHRRWTSILVATALTTAMASTMAAIPAQARVPAAPSPAAAATSLPTTTTDVAAAAAVAVATYVTAVYEDLFSRGVDPEGLTGWANALLNGTPRITVANSITYSDEYRMRLITGSYDRFLGRGPDPQGLQGWLGAMRRGVTIQEMESGFIASPEYYANSGGTDQGWITELYRHVLNRGPSVADLQGWMGALQRGANREQVAMGFLLSTENLATVVNEQYLILLHRGIDPVGRLGWVAAIQRGHRLEEVIGGIIASDEYFQAT